MKVFFMSTHPNQGTGYARVANKITNYLASIPGVEVVCYAFQNYKEQEIKDRFIDRRIKFYDAIKIDPMSPKGFGDNGIIPALIEEKPDVLFIYNDIMTTQSIMQLIPSEHMPSKKILYADIVYPFEDIKVYNELKNYNFDRIWTFLDCWKTHLIDDIGFDSSVVNVLPHGIDFDRLVDIPQGEAKKLSGFDPDDFLVLNMNRNSTHEVWVSTISAFLEFLKRQDMNPKIKLFCSCEIEGKGGGCNIQLTSVNECKRLGLDPNVVLNKHIFMNPQANRLTDDEVNNMYNAADIGLNTCCGEGFGLTNSEHIYFNRPQIVSGVPALKETIGKYACIIEPKVVQPVNVREIHGGIIYICDPLDFTDALEHYYMNRDDKPNAREYIKEQYNWENAYKVLDQFFRKQ